MKKILVVDDDRMMVEFICDCLKKASFQVRTALNGADALTAARAFKPDLMVLDLMMPDMHGFDVCEVLRRDFSSDDLKILILTAKTYEVDRKAAKRLGADDYITKPFTFEQLLASVNSLLGA